MGRSTEFARLDRGGAPGEKEGVQGAALSRGLGSFSCLHIISPYYCINLDLSLSNMRKNFFEDQLA